MHAFQIALLVLGLALAIGALLSGLANRSLLSLSALFVIAGFALGAGGLKVLRFDPRSGFVEQLALVALIVILFRDGLEVEAEMLQRAWHVPLRNLILAMPLTAALVALATHALTGLGWTPAFLVGALLSPTDPVLSSSIVTNARVPRLIRHSLNLESGMNDGLALPAVLALLAALSTSHHFVWWRFVLQDISLGLGFGVVGGLLTAAVVPRRERLDRSISTHQRSLFALGCGLAIYGATALIGHGNPLIAVFVGAITMAVRRPDLREYFAEGAAALVELVKLGIFVVFGSLLTLHGLLADGWSAIGVVAILLLVARPLAVWAALLGARADWITRSFIAWFGPKGVASMTFALLVLTTPIPAAGRIFNLTALAVVCSVLIHGATDTPGANWLARRAEHRSARLAPERV